VLCREGPHLNRKKIQRIWREEGLRVPPKRHKRQRVGISSTPAGRLSAQRPNHVWALDYQFDVASLGRTIKILHVTDEFTRESLCDLVAYSIDADATVDALDHIAAERGTFPAFVRMDNGPELTANALRDWCRFSGTGASYIEPGRPWQNPGRVYGSRMRDELLALEQFDSLLEAQVLVADWREQYNTYRPQLTPAEFAERCQTKQLQLT
jgi:putative transposase